MDVSEAFKRNIQEFGRQIAVEIKLGDITLQNDDIISCNRCYDGDMFKSVMQYVDIEIIGHEIATDEITLRFGVLNDENNSYEYLNWGTYIIDKDTIERSIDKNTTKFTAYDYLAKACINYKKLPITYPISIKNYLSAICKQLGLTLVTNSFANADQLINEEKYLDYGNYTYRDVLDEIAGAAGGIILLHDKSLSIKYPTSTPHVIDENNLKSLSLNEKWGPVNSLVLSLEPQEDNFYKRDEESIKANGLTEIKICNNELISKSRELFVEQLFDKVKGFYFYPFELDSFGYGYFEPYDLITIKNLAGEAHQCLVMNDAVSITGGVNEKINTSMPAVAVTDYAKATPDKKALYKTILEVDKQNQKIKASIEKNEQEIEKLSNSISASLSTNYVANQSYEQATKKYAPDYTLTHLKITATVTDSLMQSPVAATITWTRKVQDSDKWTALTTGESVSGNTLTISHNLAKTTQYRAVASVKVGATQYTAEKTITINVNILEDTTIKGDVCKIEASSYCFTEMKEQVENEDEQGNITTETVSVYNPGNITLTPKFFNCNFDCWQYSADLGTNFTVIEPTDEPYQFEKDDPSAGDENIVRVKVNDAYLEGVHFNKKKRILTVYYDADCFEVARAVVFKLKSDVDGGSDTVTLTLDGDYETQYGNLSDALDALKERYTSIIQELDGLEGTITTRIEQSDAIYTDMFEDVQKQISEIIQTASDITETFTSVKEWVDENGSDLEQISTYIRRSSAGIEVGEVDAAVKTLMGTSYFAILLNDSIAMKLEKDLLTIKKVLAQSGLQLGKNIFTANSVGFRITWGG